MRKNEGNPNEPIRAGFFLAVLFLAGAASGRDDEGGAGKIPSPHPYFTNVAAKAGLDAGPGQRTAFVDVDGDGYLDCVLGRNWKSKAWSLFLNRPGPGGGRVFEDATAFSSIDMRAGGKGPRGAGVLIFADVDNDGDMDAFSGMYCDLLNPGFKGDRSLRNAILVNDGKGVFHLLEKSGVEEPPATACAAVFFDSDDDGLIDLFVGNWYKRYGASLESYRDGLYRGLGGGRFRDVTDRAGLATIDEPGKRESSKPVYGAGCCDYDNDGDQDILVCVYGRQWNFLWRNDGSGRFADVAAQTGFDCDAVTHGRYPEAVKAYFHDKRGVDLEDEPPFRANGNTFSVAPADFDCDGDMDLALAEITHAWAGDSADRTSLLVNTGPSGGYAFERHADAFPRNHGKETNWNQGDINVDWIDYDNDGDQDLLLSSGDYPDGQYLRLFEQEEDHSFRDITDRCGFDWESSAGISLGDFDRDGDIDILAGKSWMRIPKERRRGAFPAPALFRNDRGNANNWITIRLRGRGKGGANALGVGARIILEAGGRTQMREIRGGCGHAGQFDPPEAHFGIGRAKLIDRIAVRWPNRKHTTQTFRKVRPNRFVRITEGKPEIEEALLPR